MKKADFIQKLSEEIKHSQKDTDFIVDKFIEVIVATLKKGDEIALPDFGKLILKKKPAHTGRNPITGESIKVPAKVVPQFKASKHFKEAVAS